MPLFSGRRPRRDSQSVRYGAGDVTVNGVPVVGGSRTESSSTKTFPLPHLGGSLSYEFTPRLTGQLTQLAFALDLGDYSGSLIETDAFMAYQLSKYFGLGGGLKYFNLNLQANTSRGGKVTRGRGHPQADAIYVLGWIGIVTLGLASEASQS